MADEVKKPLHVHSQTLKVKPSCHFSEAVQKIKERLTDNRHEVDLHQLISFLQDSMDLQKTFHDALLEYNVEVVSVSEDVEGTLDYLKRKSNVNANIVSYVLLEVETGGPNLRITRKNAQLLEQDYPCETIFDIQEAGDTSGENVAEKFSEFQPYAITKQRSEMINNWLDLYQKALWTIITGCKSSIECSISGIRNTDFPNRNVKGHQSLLNLHIQKFHGNVQNVYALVEEFKIVLNQRLPIPDILGVRRHQCQLTSFCCGLVDSKKYSMAFGFRTDSMDRTHVTISRSIDATIDLKTVREATQETRTVDEYIRNNSLKMTRDDRRRLFKLVNKYSEELMEKHSNLNRIGVSPVLSHKHGRIEEKPCIVMYCSCKGIRPPDEPEFQRQIENVPVDVREGYCSLFAVSDAKDYNDPLRTGISIGGQDIKEFGTLGPFVVEAENKSSVGFLTCQHVFPSAEIGRNIVQPSVEHYKEDTFPDTTICGEIRSMCIGDVTFNGKLTSVDVAYVALNKRIPKEFKFPDIPESMINEDFYGNPRMGQPTMHLTADDIGIRVYKLGQTSGLTEGLFDTMLKIVVLGKVKKEKVRNVYQVSSDELFSAPGDSGSSVFTAKGNTLSVIGILLGGSDNGKECYIIPIGAALQALQPRLEIYHFNYETISDAHGSNNDHQSNGASASTAGAEAGCMHGESVRATYPELSKSVEAFSIKK